MDDRTRQDTACIDALTHRRRSINSLEAAECADMLEYVDRARVAGESLDSHGPGSERNVHLYVDAAYHELSLARKLPVKTVQDTVCRTRRVRSTLPSVWAAWHDGILSTRDIALIDSAASRLTQPESLVALDASAVGAAADRTPGQLSSWLGRWVERTEPERSRERHQRAMKDRDVWVRHGRDGMSTILGVVPILLAAEAMARVDLLARSLPSSDGRTLAQARSDIFSDLLTGRAEISKEPRFTVGVTVPLSSLMGFSEQPGELTDRSASIPAYLVREALKHPGTLIYRLLTDDVGNILTVSYLGRFAPDQLNQVLEFRDGTSVFPTSSLPARLCDTDHSEPWPAETSAANTGPVNRRPHNLKTAGLIQLRQPRPGTFEWTTRTGHTYTRHPEPLPVAGWDSDVPHWVLHEVDPREVVPDPRSDPLHDTWDEAYRAA